MQASGASRPGARLLGIATAALLLAGGPLARADAGEPRETLEGNPYVYQRTGQGPALSLGVQYEIGYGSRESRNFTQQGVEQALRLRYQPLEQLGIEGFGGLVVDGASGELRGEAVGVEIIGRVLEQQRHAINVDVGAGYIHDYRDDHIPRMRLTVGRSFDRLDLSASGLLEIPVGGGGRDEVDVMATLAASYGLEAGPHIGVELAAEDLEGLEEANEAEGGAKFLLGPTLSVGLPLGFQVKLNLAAVYAYLANQRVAPGERRPDEWGFMGRAVIGWFWR